MKKISKQKAQILLTVSLTLLFWIGYELVQRGINADQTGTAGYTTNVEVIAILLSIIAMILAIFVLVSNKSKKTL